MSRRVLDPLLELDVSSDPVTIVKLFIRGYDVKTETDYSCLQCLSSQIRQERSGVVRMSVSQFAISTSFTPPVPSKLSFDGFLLCDLRQYRERTFVFDGDIRQHLSIESDPAPFQSAYEL